MAATADPLCPPALTLPRRVAATPRPLPALLAVVRSKVTGNILPRATRSTVTGNARSGSGAVAMAVTRVCRLMTRVGPHLGRACTRLTLAADLPATRVTHASLLGHQTCTRSTVVGLSLSVAVHHTSLTRTLVTRGLVSALTSTRLSRPSSLATAARRRWRGRWPMLICVRPRRRHRPAARRARAARCLTGRTTAPRSSRRGPTRRAVA